MISTLGVQFLLDFRDRFRQFLLASPERTAPGRWGMMISSAAVKALMVRAKGRAGVHQNVVIICPEGCQQFGKALVLSFNQ